MLKTGTKDSKPNGPLRHLPIAHSEVTLIPAELHDDVEIDVVVFGQSPEYTGAVMLGLKPALEGGQAKTPQAALEKLLVASAEMLKLYIPKLGAHQRNIHGGGVFDEDLVSEEIVEAERNSRTTNSA